MQGYRKKNARLRKRIIRTVVTLGILLVAIVMLLVWLIVKRYSPSTERIDKMDYFGIKNPEEVVLFLQNEKQDIRGLYSENGHFYLPHSIIKQFNSRFYWDESAQTMVYTTPTEIYKFPVNQTEYIINGENQTAEYAPVIQTPDGVYLEIDFSKQYSDFYYESYESPYRINIFYRWEDIPMIKATKSGKIRELGGIKSPIVADVQEGEEFYFLYSMEEWSCVQTKDGIMGYIENSSLSDESYMVPLSNEGYIEPVYTDLVRDHKINLAFHQIDHYLADASTLRSAMEGVKGVNVVAPTWFYLKDNDGNLEGYPSESYVEEAHNMGLEVWGLVENMSYETSTTQVVSNMASRENLIDQLVSNALQYNMDGINIDFEALSEGAEDGYSQFIRELSVHCRRNGLVLSVDNYVPSAWSMHYNRKEQGIVADYVIIMGYDEHHARSEEAGSTASIGFVKEGIENTLSEVPERKVINAMPFYTRVFTQTPEEAATEESDGILVEDPNSEYGKYLLSSAAWGMQAAEDLLSKRGITPQWIDSIGQYYGEYVENGCKYLVWLEEERSIGLKMQLVKDYNLAGAASWRLGLEKEEIWDVISSYLQ